MVLKVSLKASRRREAFAIAYVEGVAMAGRI